MVPRRRGVIVNAGSIAGLRAVPDRAAYVTTKFAVVGLTKAMALDHVKDGIRVNAVCPGTTLTPWIDERLAEAPDPDAAMATLVARQPMGRLGTAEEMAAAYLFLASDESSFTTGTHARRRRRLHVLSRPAADRTAPERTAPWKRSSSPPRSSPSPRWATRPSCSRSSSRQS